MFNLVATTPPNYYMWFEGLGCVYHYGYQDTWYNAKSVCQSMQGTLVNYLDLQNGYTFFEQFIIQHGK